jgi:hypothetical protein
MENVEIDIVGVKIIADFEVIEIMGDKDPYPALIGIDWDYDNYVVIIYIMVDAGGIYLHV